MSHWNASFAAGLALAALLSTAPLLPRGTPLAGELSIGSPSQPVRELHTSFDLPLSGSGIYDQAMAAAFFVNDDDWTSSIEATFLDETRADDDHDGILEYYSGTLRIALGSLTLEPGQVLRVVVTANAPTRPALATWSGRVASHVEVHCTNVIDAGTGPASWGLITYVQDVRVQSTAWTVRHNGADVTNQVTISSPDVLGEELDEQSPPHVAYRHADYELDLSALTLVDGDTLTFTLAATAVGGRVSTGSATARAAAPGTLTQCHKDAVNAFLTSVGAVKSGTPAKTKLNQPQNLKSASATLKAALKSCNDTRSMGSGTHTYTAPSGLKVKVQFAKPSDVTATRGEAVDIVLAVGMDGDSSDSSSNGGNADAKNELDGGCAIAVAGDGGSGASKTGNGGKATAESQNNVTGSSYALGGDGGKPSPNTKAGGSGGTATAKTGQPGGTSMNFNGGEGLAGTTSPPPGTPGKYGTGAFSGKSQGTAVPGSGDGVQNTNP